jgi:hypothetical protein
MRINSQLELLLKMAFVVERVEHGKTLIRDKKDAQTYRIPQRIASRFHIGILMINCLVAREETQSWARKIFCGMAQSDFVRLQSDESQKAISRPKSLLLQRVRSKTHKMSRNIAQRDSCDASS